MFHFHLVTILSDDKSLIFVHQYILVFALRLLLKNMFSLLWVFNSLTMICLVVFFCAYPTCGYLNFLDHLILNPCADIWTTNLSTAPLFWVSTSNFQSFSLLELKSYLLSSVRDHSVFLLRFIAKEIWKDCWRLLHVFLFSQRQQSQLPVVQCQKMCLLYHI